MEEKYIETAIYFRDTIISDILKEKPEILGDSSNKKFFKEKFDIFQSHIKNKFPNIIKNFKKFDLKRISSMDICEKCQYYTNTKFTFYCYYAGYYFATHVNCVDKLDIPRIYRYELTSENIEQLLQMEPGKYVDNIMYSINPVKGYPSNNDSLCCSLCGKHIKSDNREIYTYIHNVYTILYIDAQCHKSCLLALSDK